MKDSNLYQSNRVNRIAVLLSHLHSSIITVTKAYSTVIYSQNARQIAILHFNDVSDSVMDKGNLCLL